jgi:hypothetical protein
MATSRPVDMRVIIVRVLSHTTSISISSVLRQRRRPQSLYQLLVPRVQRIDNRTPAVVSLHQLIRIITKNLRL